MKKLFKKYFLAIIIGAWISLKIIAVLVYHYSKDPIKREQQNPIEEFRDPVNVLQPSKDSCGSIQVQTIVYSKLDQSKRLLIEKLKKR